MPFSVDFEIHVDSHGNRLLIQRFTEEQCVLLPSAFPVGVSTQMIPLALPAAQVCVPWMADLSMWESPRDDGVVQELGPQPDDPSPELDMLIDLGHSPSEDRRLHPSQDMQRRLKLRARSWDPSPSTAEPASKFMRPSPDLFETHSNLEASTTQPLTQTQKTPEP